jgi:haloalkane dehalogenase
MEFLRTPDDRFRSLPGYSFPPSYLTVGERGMRMHYVARGPRDAPPILLLHGEPSWSYLYRRMIPILAEAGHRAIAPDLIGFGRSDKPTRRDDYTIARHVDWLDRFVTGLDLRRITLVGQDWGGALGLAIVARRPERFARIVLANTFLPTGGEPLPAALIAWREFSQKAPELPISKIVQSATLTPMSPRVLAAYDAPFPDETYKQGARQFPMLIPADGDAPGAADVRAIWDALARLDIPIHTAFSDGDPILGGMDKPFREKLPTARHDLHRTIRGGGHFLQEDRGAELAHAVLDFVDGSARRSVRIDPAE